MFSQLIIYIRAGSLQVIWGMINTMQIIANITLFNINLPANASLFYSFIVDFSNFNMDIFLSVFDSDNSEDSVFY